MKITFFNEKQGCGKSTLTLLTAKALVNLFENSEQNDRRIFIFDTANSFKNSLAFKENQEIEKSQKGRIFIKYIENYDEFEIQKIEYSITEEDFIFFDLQDFTEKQYEILCHCDYIIVVSDSPNELESVDRQVYHLMQKMKNNPYQKSISIKNIFLTQNRVNSQEKIVFDFEDINYFEGIDVLPFSLQIEQMSVYRKISIPTFIQRFALEVFKKVNQYEEQIII